MTQARVLVTGGAGALGRYLVEGWPGGDVVVPLARSARPGGVVADLTDPAAVRRAVTEARPDVVIHGAALTDVDACQRDPAAAYMANVEATRHLVSAMGEMAPSARLVYISTDQVYPGPGPSGEAAPVRPASIYAWSKLWGEDLALCRPGTLVVRLNYVGAGTPTRRGLAAWLVDSLRSGRPVTLFQDVLFNPAFGGDVPGLLRGLVVAGTEGVVNLGAGGAGASKADFLLALARRLALPTATARLGRLADVDMAAPRSPDTRMDCRRAETVLGRPLPDMASVVESVATEFERTSGHG